MSTFELAILLLLALAGFAWVFMTAFKSGAPSETSARADTYAAGAGIASEQMDDIRNLDR